MTDLHFEVVDARTEPHAAVPTIMFRTRAEEADGKRVHAAALRCQIRIEPQRRKYSEREEERSRFALAAAELSLDERQARGWALLHLVAKDTRGGVGGRRLISFERERGELG